MLVPGWPMAGGDWLLPTACPCLTRHLRCCASTSPTSHARPPACPPPSHAPPPLCTPNAQVYAESFDPKYDAKNCQYQCCKTTNPAFPMKCYDSTVEIEWCDPTILCPKGSGLDKVRGLGRGQRTRR